jgi:hypothetical protein
MALPREAAVRRFSLLVSASFLWKVAAAAVGIFLLVRLGGIAP